MQRALQCREPRILGKFVPGSNNSLTARWTDTYLVDFIHCNMSASLHSQAWFTMRFTSSLLTQDSALQILIVRKADLPDATCKQILHRH